MISDNLEKLLMLQSQLVTGLTTQTIQMILAIWNPFRDWYDYDKVMAGAARSSTTLDAAMATSRKRQRAFLKQVYKDLNIEMPSDSVLNVTIPGSVDVYPRNGTTPIDVWNRPAEQFRYAISQGKSEVEAMTAMIDRARNLTSMDIALAKRAESNLIIKSSPKVKGYRRVIHPEQSQDGTSCGLCIVASTRIYKRGDLMPIHQDCNCETLPITAHSDPGKEFNDADLQKLYDAAGGNDAGSLLKTKVYFGNHGELGPIISSGSNGSQDNTKVTERTPKDIIGHQLRVLQASSERLIARQQKGEDVRQSIAWQRDRISELQQRLKSL